MKKQQKLAGILIVLSFIMFSCSKDESDEQVNEIIIPEAIEY